MGTRLQTELIMSQKRLFLIDCGSKENKKNILAIDGSLEMIRRGIIRNSRNKVLRSKETSLEVYAPRNCIDASIVSTKFANWN